KSEPATLVNEKATEPRRHDESKYRICWRYSCMFRRRRNHLYSILRNEYATSAMRIGIVLSVGSIFRNIFKTLPLSDSCQVSVILSPIFGGLSEPTIVSESWITCLSASHLNL